MKLKPLVILIAASVILVLLNNLEYFPGPHKLSSIARGLNDCISIASVLGLFTLPVLLVILIYRMIFRHVISNKLLFAVVLSLLILMNCLFVPQFFHFFARERVIEESDYLVRGIEAFHANYGVFPDSVGQLIPEQISEIKSPSIIGIEVLRYQKLGSTFELQFRVRYPLGFNYEVVTYNPLGLHKGRGESPELNSTSHSNWKYYVFD